MFQTRKINFFFETDYNLPNQKTLFPLLECRRNKNEDYQQLVRQVQSLEARLNLTIEENIDLRATIDILHDDLEQNESYESLSSSSPMTNQTTTSRPLHHRQPRNFLSSSASNTLLTSKQKVAFDAYRNQPFDEEQATITYVSNKKFYILKK